MTSWFSGLNDLSLNDLKNKVQAAIPIDAATIQKLTLTTPELTAEREKIDQEEKRKEQVRDMLAHMYPWETRDEEREILVEECKEAIMALSSDDETFFGPYKMPHMKVDTSDSTGKKKRKKKRNSMDNGENHADDDEDDDDDGVEIEEEFDDEDEEEEEEEEEDEEEEEKAGDGTTKSRKMKEPTPESLEKLAKLEPLPPLLGDFDLDAHVGLIQKMLSVDPMLVERQSKLSGGGEREKAFWRNYFFHCAFTRYEAGLSIDEIWSDQPVNMTGSASGHSTTADRSGVTAADGTAKRSEETTITFDSGVAAAGASVTGAAEPDSATVPADQFDPEPAKPELFTGDTPAMTAPGSPEEERSSKESYDMVDDDDAEVNLGEFGGELDELEAEIARELED